ncbi:head-tail connector protein [Yoonia sp.]|uniref:head-tail connector protein n=1 Tax=Yoonia sp. TaxID=2212373 RepID=UPI002E015874|nr:hypothetical protein [Yoonia sp.]
MSLRPSIPRTQHRGHVLVTPPASEPVTAAELRAQLAETETGLPDDQANALIAEARELIEQMTGIAFITQTWKLALDHWPAGQELWWDGVRQLPISEIYAPNSLRAVEPPRYPLSAVDSVTVYDEAGNAATVNIAATFDVDLFRRPGRLVLKSGATWPIALRAANAIEIEYTAGYGANGAAVPATLKRAVKQVAAYLHAHYGDDCVPEDALGSARGLLDAYAVKRL